MATYEVIIVGAGPAGLSGSLTACYLKLKHLVLEAGEVGGALLHTYPWKEVDSFLGFYELDGQQVAEKMISHVKKEGAKINEGETVTEITKGSKKHIFIVKTNKRTYQTKTVLLAMGTSGRPRKLGIPGESNPNVHYCVADPNEYKKKKVLAIGGGDTALEMALILSRSGVNVYLAHRKDQFRAINKMQEEVKRSGIKVLLNTELKKITGKGKVDKVMLINNKTNEKSDLKVDNVIICIGSVFSLDFIKKIRVKTDGDKIPADECMKTNVEGFYVAGDVTGRLKRIPEAIGEGHLAVYSIFKYLRKPYWA